MERYKSFVVSEKLNDLIILLEGFLEYSDSFKDRLYDISKKSKLARSIYDICEYVFDDDDLKNNYIDTTSKDDKVTSISQKKFNKISSKSDVGIDPFKVKGRDEIAIGRVIRSIADLGKIKYKDKDLEEFVNLYKSKSEISESTFKLVSGDDIKYWYKGENHAVDYGQGTLHSSCMVNCDEDFFNIYSNSDCCQLLILTKKDEDGEDKLIGRALVWKPQQVNNYFIYFMDRVYCLRDSDVNKFNDYADDNGYLRKYKNNSNNLEGMKFYLKYNKVKYRLVCDVSKEEEYPYMDTFKFINSKRTKISNIGFKDGYVLEDTEGGHESCGYCDGAGIEVCEYCMDSCRVDCDCSTTGSIDCNKCDENGMKKCPHCKGGKNPPLCSECRGLINKVTDQGN